MSSFGLPPAERSDPEPDERGDSALTPKAAAAKQMSREEVLSEFAFLLEASLMSSPIAGAPARAATARGFPVAVQFSESTPEPVRTAAEATRPFDKGRKQPSAKTNYNETDTAALNAVSTLAVGTACAREPGVAEETTVGGPHGWKLRATALLLVSAGLIGGIVVLKGDAPGLRKESLVISEAGTRLSAEAQKVIWQYSRQSYGQAEIYKSRLLDAIATLTKGSNPLTDIPLGKSVMWSAGGKGAGAPVALSGGELKSVDSGAESVLAGAPEPAPPRSTQSPVGTSTTLSTAAEAPPSQSPDNSVDRASSPHNALDRATSARPNRTPIVPVSSAADQGLSASEAPKPAIKPEPTPEPAAHGQATASSARTPAGTADGTSSTFSTPAEAPPPQSADHSLDRAASPRPNRTPIVPVSSAADQGLSASEAPKPAIKPEPTPEPAAHGQATASSAQSPAGTADGTSSTFSTPPEVPPPQSAVHSLDRATSPRPNRTPIVPVSSAAEQGLSASEAPKPAIKPEPTPDSAGHAQATASSAQSPAGTADSTSSTLSSPVAAPSPPSQFADHNQDRATSPPPNGTPIVPASSAADQGLSASETPKRAIKREPKPTQKAAGAALSAKPAGKSLEVAKRHSRAQHAATASPGPEQMPTQPMPALY